MVKPSSVIRPSLEYLLHHKISPLVHAPKNRMQHMYRSLQCRHCFRLLHPLLRIGSRTSRSKSQKGTHFHHAGRESNDGIRTCSVATMDGLEDNNGCYHGAPGARQINRLSVHQPFINLLHRKVLLYPELCSELCHGIYSADTLRNRLHSALQPCYTLSFLNH